MLGTVLSSSACQNRSERRPADEGALHVYPLARWRLAKADELRRVVLWVSHIVVMHHDSQAPGNPLRPVDWVPDVFPNRSRDEAREIAKRVAKEAQAHPEAFADLARKYSDDVVTRDRGGSLGGVGALDLPAVFLDALSVLKPGEASAVLETNLGFHIILKRGPPPAENLSGTRIIVRYATTFGEPSTRTRAQAYELARSIVAKARGGTDFDGLVAQAEGRDRGRGGALGIWRTTSPGQNSTMLESLARIRVNEVTEPIDTRFGFQIVKRTILPKQSEFGMRAIELEFDPTAPESAPMSQARVRAEAEKIRAEFVANPDAFETLVKKHCCSEPQRWAEGHGDPLLTTELEKIPVGQMAPALVTIGNVVAVIQRLDPSILAPPPGSRFELPLPESPDVDALVEGMAIKNLARAAGVLADFLRGQAYSDSERAVIKQALDQLKNEIGDADAEHGALDAYNATLTKLHNGLSEATYARVYAAIRAWASMQLMNMPRR